VSDIIVERRDGALWLTLNRPERLNAYSREMAHELRDQVQEVHNESAVIITGAGRGFCAGGYLANITESSEREIRSLYRSSIELFEAIRMCPRPVIAAVNGPAAGGGNELVVACDIAIAAESAWLGQTGPRVGSSPILGGANMLAMAVGEPRHIPGGRRRGRTKREPGSGPRCGPSPGSSMLFASRRRAE